MNTDLHSRAVSLDPPPSGVAGSAIRHVLFDADGVLQETPGGSEVGAEPYLGERASEFLRRVWEDELQTLAGQGELLPLIAAAMAEFGVTAPVDELYQAIWLRIEPAEESFALVRALRRNGYGVHLGTNQERNRATYMREVLGYDAQFDISCYSWELGARKPDRAFFVEAARRIGAEPAAILFVDDNPGNVAGAREAGLAAEQWTVDDGHDVLLAILDKHGVTAS
jgi:putative hydrolase of the HAD superfamily